MTVHKWSQTADDNDDIDSTINYQEGQSPGSLNNSCRALMAAIAKRRDDISGALTSTGTSTAYTVTTNQGYASLVDGLEVVMRMHTASGASPTLAPDALAAKAITIDGSTAPPAGALRQGWEYGFVYRSAVDAWIIRQAGAPSQASETVPGLVELATSAETEAGTSTTLATHPAGVRAAVLQGVPIGTPASWLTETPPTGWLESNGAAISRTTYAELFAVLGTMYGDGDGSTTFNLPDLRGYFLRFWDHGASRDPDKASRLDRGDGTTGDHVGTIQGQQYLSHDHDVTDPAHDHSYSKPGSTVTVQAGSGAGLICYNIVSSNTQNVGTGISIDNSGGNETRPKNMYLMPIIRAY